VQLLNLVKDIYMNDKLTSFSSVMGVVIANKRKGLGIEQSDLADALGLTQASYSRLESGKSTFSVDQMFGCAKAMQVCVSEIIDAVENTIRSLESSKTVTVKVPPRGNASNAKKTDSDLGAFVAGAALTALIISLAAKSK
jgi:transcriptional regulator with XRE-family HTH domain